MEQRDGSQEWKRLTTRFQNQTTPEQFITKEINPSPASGESLIIKIS